MLSKFFFNHRQPTTEPSKLTSNVFSIQIGGQAGQGIKSAGLMLSKLATRSGYNIYNYTEYPSLIRGGHNVMQINISQEKIGAPSQKTNFLIALNQETINSHADQLLPGAGVLFDSESVLDLSKLNEKINQYPVPLSKLAKDSGGQELLSNSVALGATTALLGASLSALQKLLEEEFADKENDLIKINLMAAEEGFNFATKNFANNLGETLKQISGSDTKMIVNGNEAIALGSIAAGVQFVAIYPMTPTTNILHILASYQEKYGFIYKQPEDEIAAINMAIGASFAGARSMTATSGGGFCLMTEGYGLAAMTETPLVIIEGMRPGPATGLPTWSGQGDLQFILHAHQGDFPRIILSAGDAEEAYQLTIKAFDLADKYQTPIILLVDKNICEDEQSFPLFDSTTHSLNRGKLTNQKSADYERFAESPDGISPRILPGEDTFFLTTSYEHTPSGFTTEKADTVNSQMKKRMTKITTCTKEDMPPPQLFGPDDAEITLVSWGSNKGSILQAINSFTNVNYLHLTWMNPFPSDEVKKVLEKSRYIIDIECNYTAQMAALIREKTGIEIADKMLKFDGRPFFPEEIIEKINNILKK